MCAMMEYDVIIVGGGPAGFSAGIYTSRENLRTLMLEKAMTGGLPMITDLIENYPGFPDGITGMELADRMRRQAEKFGLEIRDFSEVIRLRPEEGFIHVETDEQLFRAKAVIIATGGVPRKLNIPGETELTGRGVSYCATCDGPFYRDARIVVVGGGDAAVQEALFLTKFARQVTIVHRRDQLRAAPILQERARNNPKIDFIWNSVAESIIGQETVRAIQVRNVLSGALTEFPTEGVFMFIGWLPNTAFVSGLLTLDEAGYILTDAYMRTSVRGIFAAGDVRSKKYRQIAEACGDGIISALSASEYVDSWV